MRTFVKQGLVAMLSVCAFAAFATGCADANQRPASDPSPQTAVNDPSTQAANDPIANNHNGPQAPVNDPKPQTSKVESGPPQSAINDPQPQKPFYGPGTTNPKDEVLAKTAKPLTDAEILGIVVAANDGEVQMADVAAKKASGADVKQFAAMMKTHHAQGLAKSKTLADKSKIGTADSDVKTTLKNEVDSSLKEMSIKEGKDFDRRYMKAQVDAHKDVLTALDNRMIPSAQNGEVKTMLGETRRVVAEHLTKAESILKKVDATASLKGQGAASVGFGMPQPREPKEPGTSRDTADLKSREEKNAPRP